MAKKHRHRQGKHRSSERHSSGLPSPYLLFDSSPNQINFGIINKPETCCVGTVQPCVPLALEMLSENFSPENSRARPRPAEPRSSSSRSKRNHPLLSPSLSLTTSVLLPRPPCFTCGVSFIWISCSLSHAFFPSTCKSKWAPRRPLRSYSAERCKSTSLHPNSTCTPRQASPLTHHIPTHNLKFKKSKLSNSVPKPPIPLESYTLQVTLRNLLTQKGKSPHRVMNLRCLFLSTS